VPPIPAQAHLLEGEASQRAARMLAAKHPSCTAGSSRGTTAGEAGTTQQYRLERPAADGIP